MAQVSVIVNARRYDITCDDGEEAHVVHLAEEVDSHVSRLVNNLGQVGDARLLLLASLLLAHELSDAKAQLHRLTGADVQGNTDSGLPAAAGAGADRADEGEAFDAELRSLVQRIDAVVRRLQPEQSIAAGLEPS